MNSPDVGFIKENKKVRKQENTLKESDQEKTITVKKKERKHALDQEGDQEKEKKNFLSFCFLL